jgi:hypothetical protein
VFLPVLFVGSVKNAGKLGAAQDSVDMGLPQGVVAVGELLEDGH